MEQKQETLFKEIFAELKTTGILMVTDKLLPSVVAIIVGEPVRGSWWGHPKSKEIYNINVRLAEHPDVLVAKLVSNKNTFVHRQLWSPLVAIGGSNESWQLDNLSPVAQSLLESVRKSGQIQTDSFGQFPGGDSQTISKAAGELESRLLVYVEDIHTERGSHTRRLETWEHLLKRREFSLKTISVPDAKICFEEILNDLNIRHNAQARLPWSESSESSL